MTDPGVNGNGNGCDAVTIYTDGACLGNPGPGGWCAVMAWGGHRKELSGGYALTTNNRMEMMAFIRGLEALKRPCQVDVHTDSRYLHDGIVKGWLANWQRKGWVTADKKPVKNQDLWRRISELLKLHKVRFHWIRGHSGHPENERCDVLAKRAAQGLRLEKDEGFVL